MNAYGIQAQKMHIKDLKGNQQQQLIKPSDAKKVPMGTTVPGVAHAVRVLGKCKVIF